MNSSLDATKQLNRKESKATISSLKKQNNKRSGDVSKSISPRQLSTSPRLPRKNGGNKSTTNAEVIQAVQATKQAPAQPAPVAPT